MAEARDASPRLDWTTPIKLTPAGMLGFEIIESPSAEESTYRSPTRRAEGLSSEALAVGKQPHCVTLEMQLGQLKAIPRGRGANGFLKYSYRMLAGCKAE